MSAAWRLIRDGEGEAGYNMALDIAISEAVAQGDSPPTLRIYRWRRPSVSIGKLQDVRAGIDVGFCAAHDVPVVRRPTGGRAILHTDDVTYSVSVRPGEIEEGAGVVRSYRWISRGLIAALQLLGVDAEMGNGRYSRAQRDKSPDCFRSTAGGDVMAGGRKVIGSAQCRRRGVILQQGTLPRHAKPPELSGVFSDGLPDHPWLPLDPDLIEDAIVRGFRGLGVELVLGQASSAEGRAAAAYAPVVGIDSPPCGSVGLIRRGLTTTVFRCMI